MKYLTILFICFLYFNSIASAQELMVTPKGTYLMRGGRFNEEGLTEVEKDSLRQGKIPFAVSQRWEAEAKLQRQKRDSILQTYIGKPIPDFDAQDTEGFPQRPHMYAGRPMILHFWNFWDNSFRNEIPALNALFEKHQKNGVGLISFVNTKIGESEKEYIKNYPINFPIVENAFKFSREFLPVGMWMPYIVLVDRNGLIKHIYTPEKLEIIKSNINEKYTNVKLPTYDFEEKIEALLKGL